MRTWRVFAEPVAYSYIIELNFATRFLAILTKSIIKIFFLKNFIVYSYIVDSYIILLL